ALDGVEPATVSERAHASILLEPVADLDGLGGGDELVDKLSVDRLLHQKTSRRDAYLAGVAEFVGAPNLRRCIDVRLPEHARLLGADECHGDALHMGAGERRKLLADCGGARERNLADDGVRDEVT